MESIRRCSRSACPQVAVATLTYVYRDSTAVLGPLALYAEPHCYDLCWAHAERLTVPRGWEVLRLAFPESSAVPIPDDLVALVDAVREGGVRPAGEFTPDRTPPAPNRGTAGRGPLEPPAGTEGVRRGHLRILPDQP